MIALDFRTVWDVDAIPYDQFVDEARKNESLWRGVYQMARIPDWAHQMACERGPGVRLLVIVEDWCGDASSTVPVLAKLGDQAECLDMKVIRRDDHPEIMDRYLTDGTSRSIPIVIALDASFREIGHWGPRPAELQTWVLDHKPTMPSKELYPKMRQWYAKDRGATTLREVLSLLSDRGDIQN